MLQVQGPTKSERFLTKQIQVGWRSVMCDRCEIMVMCSEITLLISYLSMNLLIESKCYSNLRK